jgi:hypothetical protein
MFETYDLELGKDDITTRDAAYDYLKKCGLTPNPDAISQLTEAFLPALQIICERGYVDPDNPDKHFWQARGWKGIVHDIMDNAFRLRLFSWERNEFYENGALDIINFAGFYLRLKNQGRKWGEIGEPG